MTTLEIDGLSVAYGAVRAVRDVSISIAPGEAYGLIGESGSGKTTVAYAVMRHLQADITARRLALRGEDLLAMDDRALARIRGRHVAMVYQDPMSALNPMLRVGEQVAEVLRRHRKLSAAAAWARCVTLFEQVHLPDPARIARRYPHQLSGGQQQRVVIAMAIACEPDLLIMDEPTTGLDVTTEAVILELIRELRASMGASVLFISHNLAVVANVCDRVGVLYAGKLVEQGTTQQVLHAPRHPYTIGLLAAIPRPELRVGSAHTRLRAIPGALPDLRQVPPGCIFRDRCAYAFDACAVAPTLTEAESGHASACHLRDIPPLPPEPAVAARMATADTQVTPRLAVSGLSKWFREGVSIPFVARARTTRAVTEVTLDIPAGKTLAVVGESGSGKSTLARCVAGLLTPGHGRVLLDGRPLANAVNHRRRADQQAIQFIFQNPESALNPHHTVAEIIARPLRLYARTDGTTTRARVAELLDAVKLGERHAGRYPRELSGGEKQRVCIARAFAASPSLVICDEPTSALDISVQAAILNELVDLQARYGTSYLFISHDLAVVQHVADRVAVMYQGRVVEYGTPDQVFASPNHPYTEALLAAVPRLDGTSRPRLDGPGAAPESGCVFHPRCLRKLGEVCETTLPSDAPDDTAHVLACHIPQRDLRDLQRTP